MTWNIVESMPVSITSEDFWRAVSVWNRVPHVLNRRLACSETVYREEMGNELDSAKLKSVVLEVKTSCPSFKENSWEDVLKAFHEIGYSFPISRSHKYPNTEIVLKKLVPKNPNHSPCLELEILEQEADVATYIAVFYSDAEPPISPRIPYQLSLVSNCGSMLLELKVWESLEVQERGDNDKIDRSVEWLKSNLLPKFHKWANSSESASSGSLKLIPVVRYNSLYHALKEKHVEKLMSLWTESTDPKKFIHEDIGIAAYLLLLWEQERKEKQIDKKQTFVDVGCGNGLLVYILNEEGHPGIGVDVRSRQIWNVYPPATQLMVCTVNPTEKIPFPAMDWFIGNHSDELTPWIPVMAAMNPHSRFFVLPCCPYDFFGRYGRKNPKRSIYQEYLEFVQKDVCEHLCKFNSRIDRLRIPSTKRVCIIGSDRARESVEKVDSSLSPNDFLHLNLGYCKTSTCTKDSIGTEGLNCFVPRPAVERVRNCTKVDPRVISEVVNLVAAELLTGHEVRCAGKGEWDCGKTVHLEVLAKLIPGQLLEKLKNEAGGLQTLLKNNHFIFKVTQGVVCFRKPVAKSEFWTNPATQPKQMKRNDGGKCRWKSRPCWFYLNHPDGCPLLDAQCSYIHVK